jgi:hypothetical protein
MKRLADQELVGKKSKVSEFEANLELEEVNYESSWPRAAAKVEGDLEFHCIEIDEVVLPQNLNFNNPYSITEVVALRAYGVTMVFYLDLYLGRNVCSSYCVRFLTVFLCSCPEWLQ